MSSAYEKQRLANIARNKALLASLGLDEPAFKPKEKPRAPKPKTKKRKLPVSEESEENGDESASKVSRADSCDDASGRRRSQRNAGKVIDYNAVQAPRLPAFASPGAQKRNERGTSPSRKVGTRQHDPKTFGAIPGIKIGTWWEKREECSADSIHAPWVAGISGGDQGAYSIALSGGYEDDVDMGYAFTYTGSGGRDLKGTANNRKNLRTAPQSSNQSFENSFNKALKISSETKKPVRVIRGYKLKSRYAPSEGYRYDGLYRVEKAWMEKGLNDKGYLVCKFAFKRLDGQAPLPVNDEDEEEGEQNEDASDGDDAEASNSGSDEPAPAAAETEE